MVDIRKRRNCINRFWINIREQGLIFYVPFLFNYLLIPMIVFDTYKKFGLDDQTRMTVVKFSQYFTPVLVSWWIFFALIKYIDGEGNEIFYVQNRMKAKEVIVFYIVYIVSIMIPFLFYRMMFSGMELEWLRIAIESWIFAALTYFFSFFCKNIAVAMIPVVGYAFASVFLRGMQTSIFLYYEGYRVTPEMLLGKYMILLGIAFFLFLAGMFLNYKMERYTSE